jgi:hypothetical protein
MLINIPNDQFSVLIKTVIDNQPQLLAVYYQGVITPWQIMPTQ